MWQLTGYYLLNNSSPHVDPGNTSQRSLDKIKLHFLTGATALLLIIRNFYTVESKRAHRWADSKNQITGVLLQPDSDSVGWDRD